MLACPASTPSWCSHSCNWAGHVVSMPDPQLPKRLFYGELQQRRCFLGGQKKCYKDTLKVLLKTFNISIDTWEQTAWDRGKWQASVHKGAKTCKANRIAAAEQCRQARKNSTNRSPKTVTIPCPYCQRTFWAWNGLTSHLHTHRDHTLTPGWLDGPHHFWWTNKNEKKPFNLVSMNSKTLQLGWLYNG